MPKEPVTSRHRYDEEALEVGVYAPARAALAGDAKSGDIVATRQDFRAQRERVDQEELSDVESQIRRRKLAARGVLLATKLGTPPVSAGALTTDIAALEARRQQLVIVRDLLDELDPLLAEAHQQALGRERTAYFDALETEAHAIRGRLIERAARYAELAPQIPPLISESTPDLARLREIEREQGDARLRGELAYPASRDPGEGRVLIWETVLREWRGKGLRLPLFATPMVNDDGDDVQTVNAAPVTEPKAPEATPRRGATVRDRRSAQPSA